MRNGIIIAIGIGAMIGAIFLAIRSTKEECKEEQEEPEKDNLLKIILLEKKLNKRFKSML